MFLITLAGAVIARCGTWIMILGAHLAAVISGFTAGDPVAGILKVSNDLVPGFGNIALLVFALRLSAVIVLDLYGGSLTLISSIDSLKRVRPALAIRILTVVITAAISGILADSQAAALEVPDTKKRLRGGSHRPTVIRVAQPYFSIAPQSSVTVQPIVSLKVTAAESGRVSQD